MSAPHYDVLIVGAGHGGAQAATMLRQLHYAGTIALVSAEPEPPYDRPALSKDYLAGAKNFERIVMRQEGFWAARDLVLLLGRRVVAIEPRTHLAVLADGGALHYGTLIWAAGGVPRRLGCAGHDLTGVHGIRTRADVDALLVELPDADRIVVIGGGYIGLEAASVLVKLGKHVTVLEALDRVLARVAGEPLSRFYEAEHRAHGVDLRTGVTVAGLSDVGGRVTGVRLGDGNVLAADMVIVGIGIIPAVEPLLEAGAAGGNGVDVDSFCRTSLADIYAIGDCARHANHFADGARIRLESVQNATEQANVVARAIAADAVPYHAIPWFWSNQYDLRLQTVGLSLGFDAAVVRGAPVTRSFSVMYLRRGKVIALDCVNAAADYVQGKALILAGGTAPVSQLADASVSIKDTMLKLSTCTKAEADPLGVAY